MHQADVEISGKVSNVEFQLFNILKMLHELCFVSDCYPLAAKCISFQLQIVDEGTYLQ